MRLPEFPAGRYLQPEESDALRIAEELRPILDCLSAEVAAMWRASPNDTVLQNATASLTISGASLQRNVVTVGKYVLQRTKPYWGFRRLITQEEYDHLSAIAEEGCLRRLDAAITLDSRIRSRLNLSSSD